MGLLALYDDLLVRLMSKKLVIDKHAGSVFIRALEPVMKELGAFKKCIPQSFVLDTNSYIDEAPRCP